MLTFLKNGYSIVMILTITSIVLEIFMILLVYVICINEIEPKYTPIKACSLPLEEEAIIKLSETTAKTIPENEELERNGYS